MEIPIYLFEGTMELHEWFQRLEEYFEYTRFQKEHDKSLIASLHLTGQAYTWVKRQYKYWEPSFPWDTFDNFKEELEFEEKWNYKERKALELEYYDDIEEEALEEDDDKKLEEEPDEEMVTADNNSMKDMRRMIKKITQNMESLKKNSFNIFSMKKKRTRRYTIEQDLKNTRGGSIPYREHSVITKSALFIDANRNALEFLQQLEYLNLSAFHITGSTPTEIFNRENLRELDLSLPSYRSNELVGRFPMAF
eukprot:Gb_36760 [translate_table: standard]